MKQSSQKHIQGSADLLIIYIRKKISGHQQQH